MTQDEIDRLFTMSVEAQMGTGKERGAGIGLFITHEFVNLNKGKISIQSQKGIGSTIKISLPEFIPQ
jgi:signal transduction histidine kinase